ncbi:hypothetical protein ACIBSW_35375 [Actinoplanes sp. NPDC049668]|uniref:hypothetical protein n=1 Tax=unclassified Actinoplanes TaxID=2626549 RepID=UPI0033B93532
MKWLTRAWHTDPDDGTTGWDRAYEYGLGYTMVVVAVPLGLWLLGIQKVAGLAFGGRDYVLNLSGSVVVCALAVAVVLRRGWTLPLRWVNVALAVGLAAAAWSAVGVAHHGLGQTLTGLRLILVPVAMIVVVVALRPAAVRRLLTLLSWLVVANAVAGLVELAVGPARLVRIGFSEDRNIRYIDGVFRVPGLTTFNAELGMLAGVYLLGYLACWLTPRARPRRWSWHAGAVAATTCLAMSTSRSGALLVLGGVLGAVLLPRSRSRARRVAMLALAGGLVVAVVGAFAVLGAAGSRSLFERFGVWAGLLRGVPAAGFGIGGAGAATYSRVADSPPVFVDNYYLNLGLQFGPVVMAVLIAAVVGALAWLAKNSAARPQWVMPIALVAGLAAASLVIDTWEFQAAMLAAFLFCAHGLRPEPRPVVR